MTGGGRRWLTFLAAAVWLWLSGAAVAQTAWREAGGADGPRVHLYFYWSESCPHCQVARPFVTAIPERRPWVVLHDLEVSRHPEHARRFVAMAGELGRIPEGVPALLFCGRMEVGWRDAASSGAALLAALDDCRARGAAAPPPATIHLPLVGEVDPGQWSLPAFTVVLAALDAFNPCAFFVLLFLLSLLSHQQDRRRMLIVGGLFVLASGVMYFAFMAAWLNVFALLGPLAGITLAAGLLAVAVGLVNVKDFFAFHQGPSLSIPETAKPGLYRRARAILQSPDLAALVAATVVLAVAANFYELLCTAGFPMVFTRLLTLHEPSAAARYGYLVLYNVVYVVPLALIVLAFVRTLSARKLGEREGRLLKLMSGVMMLELGLVLVLAPEWLSSLAVAGGLLAGALAVTGLAARLTRRPDRG